MAIKEPFMVKQVYGDTAFELEAKPGQSLLVKDIIIENPLTTVGYVTVKIGKTVVGFFRVAGNLGNQLSAGMGSPQHSHALAHNNTAITTPAYSQIVDALGVAITTLGIVEEDATATEHANVVKFGNAPNIAHKTLFSLLRERGFLPGYPVGEGEKLILENVKQSTSLQLVIYEIHDAGDFTPEMPNGSKADEYLFINYGRPAAAVTTKTDTIYNTVQSPAEFPDFPLAKDVPAKTEIELLGILASDLVDYRSATDFVITDYLKLIRERETLFDEDKNGLIHMGVIGNVNAATIIARGYSLFGNYSTIDHKLPLLFDPTLVFTPGEELGVYVHSDVGTAVSAASLAAADLEIGLIERVKKLA